MPAIDHLLGSPAPFLRRLFATLAADGLDVAGCELDHLCYRVETPERYAVLKAELAGLGELLSEKEIGGRPIATFELADPIRFGDRRIPCLELPAPKPGSPYPEGYEHAEFVIDRPFDDFMRSFPHLKFDTKGMHKGVNPEIRLIYEGFSVKFHHHSLAYVIRYLE